MHTVKFNVSSNSNVYSFTFKIPYILSTPVMYTLITWPSLFTSLFSITTCLLFSSKNTNKNSSQNLSFTCSLSSKKSITVQLFIYTLPHRCIISKYQNSHRRNLTGNDDVAFSVPSLDMFPNTPYILSTHKDVFPEPPLYQHMHQYLPCHVFSSLTVLSCVASTIIPFVKFR